jgi:hypothetical protein
VVLLATKASLVVRRDLHPALPYLLLNAAEKIHAGPSIFNRSNAFPAVEAGDIPLSDEALRFYKSGLPFLHDYFPFWIAALIGKLVILLITIVGVRRSTSTTYGSALAGLRVHASNQFEL